MGENGRLSFIIIPLIVSTILSACAGDAGKLEPEIRIHSDSEELTPIYYGNINNQEQKEVEGRLQDFMVGKRFSDLPTLAYGDNFQIEALNFETAEIEISNYVLDENANIISEYPGHPVSTNSVEEGIAEISFDESNEFESYQDYALEGKLIHGLVIRCEIDGNTFVFSTIVLGE